MKTNPQTRWAALSIFCAGLYLGPCVFLLLTLAPLIKTDAQLAGIIRFQPGQTFITEPELARKHPDNRAILICESLNRKTCELILSEPTAITRLKTASTLQVGELFADTFGSEGEELFERAAKYPITWENKAGPYGMFLLIKDTPPKNGPIFGWVELTDGQEKTQFLTEKTLNSLLRKLEDDKILPKKGLKTAQHPLEELLRLGIKNGEINPVTTPDILGTCLALNIQYRPERNLFLSNATQLKIATWEKIAPQISK